MWIQETSKEERKTLVAAFAGYGVDAFDYMIYTFLIPTLMVVWAMSKVEAGYIATGALVTSAIGGWAAGILADKYGRVRVLQWTVMWFTFFTFLSGFTNSFEELFFTRAMQGFGFGGEWSVGAVLIAEMIQAKHRGKAVGLVQSSWAVGWGAAAIAFWAVYAWLPAEQAWRVLFWLGILPAFLIFYIRRNIKDPEVFHLTQAKKKAEGGGQVLGNFFAQASQDNHFRQPAVDRHDGLLLRGHHLATDLPQGRAQAFCTGHQRLPARSDSGFLHRLSGQRLPL